MDQRVQVRQGDVFLKPITKVSSKLKLKKIPQRPPLGKNILPEGSKQPFYNNHQRIVNPYWGAVLAAGEHNGHNHVLVADPEVEGAEVVLYKGNDGKTYVSVSGDGPALFEHPDHGIDSVLPGLWEVKGQDEYDPENEQMKRRVLD